MRGVKKTSVGGMGGRRPTSRIEREKGSEDVSIAPLADSERREVIQEALLEGAKSILRHERFEEAARAIFDVAKRLIGAQAGYIALLNKTGEENEVVFLDAGGLECVVDPFLPMPIRGFRREAYESGRPLFNNRFAETEWIRFMPEGHVALENVLFAPLMIEGSPAGLLGLANKPGGFCEEDAQLAGAFAENASIALHNSRLLESLRTNEQRLRSVTESATDAVICIGADGTVTLWNSAAEGMFGYSREEMLGRPLTPIMPDELRPAHEAAVRKAVETGRARLTGETLELVARHKDGTEFPIELSLGQWQSGDDIFFTGVVRDITERKKRETLSLALNDINRLVGSTLEYHEIVEHVVSESARVLNCGSIALLLKEERGWVLRHARGLPAEMLGGTFGGEDMSEWLSRLRDPLTVADTKDDDRTRDALDTDLIRSLLVVPLLQKETVQGLLAFGRPDVPAPFDEAEIDFARKLAASTALAIQNARLYEQEHRIAQILQENLIVKPSPVPGVDIGLAYGTAVEAERVGGDFYDVFELDPGLLAILVGDVAGKGVRAAGLTETIRSSVRTLAYIDPSPGFVFGRLNETLLKQTEAEEFASAVLMVLDLEKRVARVANAGHPSGVFLGPEPVELRMPEGLVLGVGSATYLESRLDLTTRRGLLLFTDGLIEARRDGELYGAQRLLEFLSVLSLQSAQQIVADVFQHVSLFTKGQLQDDIALVSLVFSDH
ncbi:MAG: PAS domain S-box protein [Actinobacteria bacterium]|nr:MAG: PAS domain S-box protein [Actinomycetota bacterium]